MGELCRGGMRRTVEGPAPHQSHSSQHPADEFVVETQGRSRQDIHRDTFPLLNCFTFWWRLRDVVLEDASVWFGLIAVVRLFFLWACSIPFWASLSIMVLMACFFLKLSLISVEFSFFFRPLRNTLTSTDAARLPDGLSMRKQSIYSFIWFLIFWQLIQKRTSTFIPWWLSYCRSPWRCLIKNFVNWITLFYPGHSYSCIPWLLCETWFPSEKAVLILPHVPNLPMSITLLFL